MSAEDQPSPTSVRAAFTDRYGRGREASAGGPGPLDGIAVYRGEEHWHLVTLGLAAVVPPVREDRPDPGALGHELTVLVPPTDEPPAWAFGLLDGAARTAVAVGRPFHVGARMAPGAPVDGGRSGLVATGVRADPVIPAAGGAELLQLVGVTAGEFLLMQRVGTALVLEKLAARDPLLRTDPSRA